MYQLEEMPFMVCSISWNRISRLATGFEQMDHILMTPLFQRHCPS